jgi:hypothetical protein
MRDMAWMLIASLAFTVGIFVGYDQGVADGRAIERIAHSALWEH